LAFNACALIAVVVLALVYGTIRLLIRVFFRGVIVDPILADLDSFDEETISARFATTPIQRKLAYQFQAKYGVMRYNKANRILASEWVRAEMASMSMRSIDIVRHMDLTIELCLTPTSSAVHAQELASSRAIRERRAAFDSPK
jgi:hypothetical protein